jgi:putative nucleotidyltransferase with HDIG domain
VNVRLEGAFFRSRLGRRILGLFVLCALIPTGAALTFMYVQADRRLADERRERVRVQSKLGAEQVLQRIRIIEREFVRTVHRIETTERAEWNTVADSATAQLVGFAAEAGLGDIVTVFGDPPSPPPVTELVRGRLDEGRSILATVPDESGRSRVILVHQAQLEDGPILMWGELDSERLAAETASFSAAIDLCMVDHRQVPIFCNIDLPDGLLPKVGDLRTTAKDAYLEWRDGEVSRIGAYAQVFVTYDYAAPPWMIVAGERTRSVLSELSEFRLTLVLAGAMGIVLTVLLGSIQIRRSLEPLHRLKEGTHRVADGNFSARVDIASGDEFTDLADSFNEMTHQLDQQFQTLHTLRAIDQAVLETPTLDEIASASLVQATRLTGCGVACLIVKDGADGSDSAVGFVHSAEEDSPERIPALALGDHDDEILQSQGLALVTSEASLPCLGFDPIAERSEEFLAVGIRQQGNLHGLLALGFPPETCQLEVVVGEACQLAGQLAVALANVRLVSDLDRLSAGALQTLARTVDAKSAWTAGHSERVTRLSQAIAAELGLSAADQDRLYRGGLLHDIGKLGVSEETLDWPGKLNDEQWEEIRRHPTIGVEILEPLPVFLDILPIVHYHHEKWDGTGYPTGIAGEDIPLLARVVAVADVYDALTSDRPYRAGMPREKAIQIIDEGSGTHFDAEIVPVLREALGRLEEADTWSPDHLIAVGE